MANDLSNLRNRLNIRLNNRLIEMKPDHDDSIAGFNEAWDIVRQVLAEEIAVHSPTHGEEK